MDPEVEKNHFSTIARGRVTRRKYVKRLSIAASPLIVSTLGMIFSASAKAPGWVSATFGLAFAFSFLLLIPYAYRAIYRIISPLDNLDRAFEILYEALETYDKAPNFQDPHVQQDISNVLDSVYLDLQANSAIEGIMREPGELLQRTYENIETRLLPAAREGKIDKPTVDKLVKILSDPKIDSLRAFNSEVESSFVENEKSGMPVGRTIAKFLRTKVGKLASALALGLGIITGIAIVYSIAVGQDVPTFFRNNPALIIGSGVVLAVGILALLRE